MRLKKQGTSTYQLSRAPRGTCLDWGIIFGFPLISMCLLAFKNITKNTCRSHSPLNLYYTSFEENCPKALQWFPPKMEHPLRCPKTQYNPHRVGDCTLQTHKCWGFYAPGSVKLNIFHIHWIFFFPVWLQQTRVDNKSFVAWIDLFTALCKPSWPWVKS